MIDTESSGLSIGAQCRLLEISRSGLYKAPKPESEFNLMLMQLIDEEFTRHPFLGVRRMTEYLKKEGFRVGPKRIRRLMRLMCLNAIYPKPNLSQRNSDHEVFPYLLRNFQVTKSNEVWSTDITYIRMNGGFVYLVAIIDWYSRYVISWELSNSLETEFCKQALNGALVDARPEIFNTDQGSQFTSHDFTKILKDHEIKISMDGKGRALDNVFCERLWRSLKYEEVYLKQYATMQEARKSIEEYFRYYNHERLHQSLEYRTPAEVYFYETKLNKKVA